MSNRLLGGKLTMFNCLLDENKSPTLHSVLCSNKKDKKYGVPKSLIPKYIPYNKFNPLSIPNNSLAEIHIVSESCVVVHIFKLKTFKDKEKAMNYAAKKGHNIVYDLKS
ncbi:MAG: hypothetical protein R3321_00090 [Nitrososphaeraceae archaeon]|nr:hypothetical protein [Nitrososphaeraceae archaeon]